MFPSLADQEQNCLIIGLDAGLFFDFIQVILGMRGHLDSCLMNFPPLYGQILILILMMMMMNCLSHTIDYSRTHY